MMQAAPSPDDPTLSTTDFNDGKIDFERAFVRVYKMPEKLTAGYCFGGGVPITFLNVDWFEAPTQQDRSLLVDFISNKSYYDRKARFLVVGDHPNLTFIIEPKQDGA